MHTSTLPKNTESVINNLKGVDYIDSFYLSGGTALALQIGHRESEDLDFFTQVEFVPQELQKSLEVLGNLKDVVLDKGTLNCYLDGVQLQFLHYPYKLLNKKVEWNSVFLSSILDIACTKMITISARGSRKDFIDIYFLLKQYDLVELFKKLQDKYSNTDYNLPHILKSLVYFKDAGKEPLPRMHKRFDWKSLEKELIRKTKEYEI